MPTMKEIAQRAGVSQTSVSFVLNNRQPPNGSISEATRARVLDAAHEMGYKPNELARAMTRGRSRTIGFLTRNPSAEFVARFIMGALEEADERGYFVKVLQVSGENPTDADSRILDQCIELRLSGVIAAFMPPTLVARYHEELARYQIPLALLDDVGFYPWGSPVMADYAMGMHQAVAHLFKMGHRHIGYVGGTGEPLGTQNRYTGLLDALKFHGLQLDARHLILSEWEPEGVVEVVRAALEKPANRPTALICSTDATGLLVQRAARSLGMQLPSDLSVISFGDLTASTWADPPLTVVHHPFQEMGREAARELLDRTEAHFKTDEPMPAIWGAKLPTHLIVRQSTSAPRAL